MAETVIYIISPVYGLSASLQLVIMLRDNGIYQKLVLHLIVRWLCRNGLVDWPSCIRRFQSLVTHLINQRSFENIAQVSTATLAWDSKYFLSNLF
ncbi:hypothetical protein KC343_g15 [Hortaea werneckii]|nr:hypothetical protein KC317_g15 [Hortaea werneckii]KAI7628686.1 hypothetical protein KC346_g15 [Hortaea werneckii]KAI7638462.1 hypothetical protein KC343_g15 [Hortaea werneckii]